MPARRNLPSRIAMADLHLDRTKLVDQGASDPELKFQGAYVPAASG
jgi:hypothetical protein